MKTLVIYDTAGKIFNQITGNYEMPVGIPYLEIEIPAGKYIIGVDVSVAPNEPIYENIPASEFDTLKSTVDALVIAMLEG